MWGCLGLSLGIEEPSCKRLKESWLHLACRGAQLNLEGKIDSFH